MDAVLSERYGEGVSKPKTENRVYISSVFQMRVYRYSIYIDISERRAGIVPISANKAKRRHGAKQWERAWLSEFREKFQVSFCF